jgi:hypothetical protein
MKKTLITLSITCLIAAYIFRNKNKSESLDNTKNPNSKSASNFAHINSSQQKNQDRNVASSMQKNEDEIAKKEEDLLDHLRSMGNGEWKFIRNSDGRIMTVSGGKIPSVGKNPGAALDFAQKIAPYFKVDSAQVTARKDDKSFSQTALSKIYRFEQKIDNYKVYGAGITLMTAKNDDSAFMITTDLKEVKGLSLKAAKSTSAEDFKSTVLNEFSSQQKTKITYIEPKPVIWANSEPAELAWVYLVETQDKKYQKLKVLVGADSGKVLIKQKVSFN